MQIIDGRGRAQKIREEVAVEVATLPFQPGLGVILVGEDTASHLYVSLKERAAQEAGIHFERYYFPEGTAEEKIIATIAELNNRRDIDAILVQVPLPAMYNEDNVTQTIAPDRDVDGFHPVNVSRLKADDAWAIIPPVVLGIVDLIKASDKTITGKRAAILGNSELFIGVIAAALNREGITLAANTPEADIVVVAKGKIGALGCADIKDGAIVIDVGTNRLPDGRVVGDVDHTGLAEKRGWISPVPGGVGPMTVALLLKNVVTLAKRNRATS